MSIDEGTAWPVLCVPVMLAVMGAATLRAVTALVWWLFPGQVTCTVAHGSLTARRVGRRQRCWSSDEPSR